MNEYLEFLENKKKTIEDTGFDVDENDMNPMMFGFQKYCVRKALKRGKYALFEDCGLGKSVQQLEWAEKIIEREKRSVLIVSPLAVVGQTILEGVKFGYEVTELDEEVKDEKIYITNYDNIGNVEAHRFAGVVLDESSILKNFDGEMKKTIIDLFSKTKYKLACTATPSPNDVMELCNHAEFLDVMGRNEMLSMYFVHDGGETTKWRLKGHCEHLFWDFVSEWAVMLNKPSDIGYPDTGYLLPRINMIEEYIETKKRDNMMLFNDVAVNATGYNAELRMTMEERMNRVSEIVRGIDGNVIVWIKQDAEGDMLRRLIPEAVEVRGSESPSAKRDKLLGFGQDKFRVLITKLKIAQFGLNYQNCHNQIFASLDFSFESTYQGMRRSWRFGQKHEVNIYLICTDTMQNVKDSIERKRMQFAKMQKAMTIATNRNIGRVINRQKLYEFKSMTLPQFIS